MAADFEVLRRLAEFLKKLVPQNADNVFSLGKPDEQGFSGVPLRRIFTTADHQTTTEVTDVTRQTFPGARCTGDTASDGTAPAHYRVLNRGGSRASDPTRVPP